MRCQNWDIYVAAGFGAIVSTLVDLIWNPTTSMTTKMREILVQNVSSELDAGWPVLVLIVLLGLGAAFVNRPTLRFDGFTRGLAVFALLSIPPSPTQLGTYLGYLDEESPKFTWSSLSNLIGIQPAYAQFGGAAGGGGFRGDSGGAFGGDSLPWPTGTPTTEGTGGGGLPGGMPSTSANPVPEAGWPASGNPNRSTPTNQRFWSEKYDSALAIVQFQLHGDPVSQGGATLLLRNITTGKSTRYQWDTSKPLIVEAPKGEYELEVDAPGYKRTRTIIPIGDDLGVFQLELFESRLPLGLQQLLSPKDIALKEVSDQQKARVILNQALQP
jgi:hypothetical protein